MPKTSERRKCIKKILDNSTLHLIFAPQDEEDGIVDRCVEDLSLLLLSRYLSPRLHSIPKSRDWFVRILPDYDNRRFKSCLRISREAFRDLLGLISGHQVFTKKRLGKPMISVDLQLAIALHRLGFDGAGASHWNTGQKFGVSDCGMVRNSVDRIIKVLLSFKGACITWPCPEERKRISQFMENKLPKCIGYIDGTHVDLFEAPLEDHESYYSRKQKYGIQVQAVVDNDLLFRDITVGYPASVHDSRVYFNSPMGQTPELFLTNGQWLAGDSAYKLTEHILTPFRDNSVTGTVAGRKKFNQHFSGYRVKVEQAFGILKNRFGSLKSLRVRVDKTIGHRRACEWILGCCILHNILTPSEDNSDYVDEIEADSENYEPVIYGSTSEGEQKRQALYHWISEFS